MTPEPRSTARTVTLTALALLCLTAVRVGLGSGGQAAAALGTSLDAAAAVAAVIAARSAGRLARDPRSAWAWRLHVAFPAVWLVAPLAWLAGLPDIVADVARVVALVLVAASWWHASRAGGPWARVRLGIDGGIGAAALFAAGWGPVLSVVWERSGGGAAGIVAVGLPVLTAGLVVTGAGVTWLEMRDRNRLMPGLLLVVLLLLGGSDLAWGLGAVPIWATAWVVDVLASRAYLGTSPRATVVATRHALVFAPYLLMSPALLTIAIQAASGDVGRATLAGAAVITVLLLVRQHVTLVENRHLVLRLEATERRLRHQATHDSLTGLPGRVVLMDRLEQLAGRRAPGGPSVTLAFLDLDGFKEINDRYGHATGDAVLVAVARRLREALARLGADALAVRMSGDEFAVLLVGRTAHEARATAAELIVAIEQPLAADGADVRVGVSLGIATCSDGPLDPSALLRSADTAMYAVKRAGAGEGECGGVGGGGDGCGVDGCGVDGVGGDDDALGGVRGGGCVPS